MPLVMMLVVSLAAMIVASVTLVCGYYLVVKTWPRGVGQAIVLPPAVPSLTKVNPRARVFKILSYNVHGLPFFWKQNAKRASELTRYLGSVTDTYDVVALQEVFSKTFENTLRRFFRSRGWYVTFTPRALFPFLANSGLFLASKYRLEDVRYDVFQPCCFTDCASTKGGLSATVVKRNGQRHRVCTVHLQDSTWPGSDGVQKTQLRELSSKQKKGTVFVGDFNIRSEAMKRYAESLLGPASFPSEPTFGNIVLDGAFGARVASVQTLHPKFPCFVSDHQPISVVLR